VVQAGSAVEVWDTGGERVRVLEGAEPLGYRGPFQATTLVSRAGSRLVTRERHRHGAEYSTVLAVWNASTWHRERLVETHESVTTAAIAADGRLLAEPGGDGEASFVVIRDLDSGAVVLSLPVEGRARCLAFSPDGRWVAAGGGGRRVQVLRVDGSPLDEPR
jgi:WD40 repeat protein